MPTLQRFNYLLHVLVPRSRLTRRLLLLAWLSLHALPFFLHPAYREALFQQNMFGQSWEINVALVFLVYLAIFETAFFALCSGLAKGAILRSESRAYLGVIAGLTTIITLSAYLFFLAAAWVTFEKAGSFLTLSDLLALFSTLDLTNVLRVASARDLQMTASLLLGASTTATLFFLVVPVISVKRAFKQQGMHLLLSGVFLLVIAGGLRITVKTQGMQTLRPVLRHYIAPQLAFWASPLFFGSDSGLDLPAPPKTTPAYSLAEYRSRVSQQERANVVFLMVEALRHDTVFETVQSRPVAPTLRALAESGLWYSRAYSQSSETAYSQLTILTGQYPLRFPTRDLHYDTSYPMVRIYDLLSSIGYRTALLTFEWPSTKRVTASPFLDFYLDGQYDLDDELRKSLPEHYRTLPAESVPSWALDRVHVDVLRKWITEEQGRPFFAALYLYASHFPYDPPPGTTPFEPTELSQKPSFFGYPPELREPLKNRYRTTINYIDSLIGDLLESLRSLDRDTIVVITGDHGELFGEHNQVTHGGYLHEEVLRVPLIITSVAGTLPSYAYHYPVGQVQIAPSVLKLLELPEHGAFQTPALPLPRTISANNRPEPIFATIQSAVYEDAVIDWPWKLVLNRRGRGERLFNLKRDPDEEQNRINSLSEQKKLVELRQMLAQFRTTQFAYYLQEPDRRDNFFPPRYSLAAEQGAEETSGTFQQTAGAGSNLPE